jgi:CRISPR-associated protein Csm3
MNSIQLHGKVLIACHIRAVTGLRIGGGSTGIEIGGVDNVVVRNPLTNEPYIPGSSLKGKMRSLLERHLGKPLTRRIKDVRIHECKELQDYKACPVCRIFGVASDQEKYENEPTRFYARDVFLSAEGRQRLKEADTDLPFTEAKAEIAIDRINSKPSLRTVERVPAGAVFGPCEFVFNFYEQDDVNLFMTFLQTLELLQDDYLGGGGSRGSGKIALENISVTLKSKKYYDGEEDIQILLDKKIFEELKRKADELKQQIQQRLFAG